VLVDHAKIARDWGSEYVAVDVGPNDHTIQALRGPEHEGAPAPPTDGREVESGEEESEHDEDDVKDVERFVVA
jgi:hypothetical protein